MKRESARIPAVAMLTHFTRASAAASALDNLVAILKDGVIRGGSRMVRGARPAVCMFDVPFAELRTILDRRNRRRYEPFGIAVDKRYAFTMGARPAISRSSRRWRLRWSKPGGMWTRFSSASTAGRPAPA